MKTKTKTGAGKPAKTARSESVALPKTEAAPDELKMIRRAELFPDPDQPRKTFSEASLDELALSIMEQGLVQPLIVRLVPAKFKISEPDLVAKQYHVQELAADGHWDHAFQSKSEAECRHFAGEVNLTSRYVIIAGERRWRSSGPREIKAPDGVIQWKGLEELPCVVRDVDARRKFAQQLIENNQREGVSAIEEAEALEREYTRRRLDEPDLSKEAFAKEVGMSRADFYGTLVLTRLHAPVRAALKEGKISASLAKVVAMVPEPKQQEKLLKHLTNEKDYCYPFSVRDAQEIVDDEYVKNLNDAPFSKDAAFLHNKDYPQGVLDGASGHAMVVTCEACPHRSGNMATAFPELAKRPNVCTNPHCFAVKCKAHWVATAERARTDGKTVLTETEFRKVKGEYVKAKDGANAQNNWYDDWDKVIGRSKPEATLVATKEGLITVYKKEEALAAARKNGITFSKGAVQTPEEKRKEEEKEKLENAKGERREQFVKSLTPELVKVLRKLNDKTSWQVAALLGEGRDRYDRDIEKAFESEKEPRMVALGALFTDQGPLDYENGWTERALKAWKLAGIDLKERFDQAEKAAQAPLPLAKKAPEQGELLAVKKNKTLSPAPRARWAKVKAKAQSKGGKA